MPDLQGRELNAHRVELTDDVFVWDAQGKRIPRIIVPVERLP